MKDLEHFSIFIEWKKKKMLHERLDRHYNKKYKAKRKKLRENLNIEEKVLVLTERIQKKITLKILEQSLQNIAYFNRKKSFSIRKNQKIDQITYYWVKNLQNRKLTKRFQRTELFAVNNNFTM